MFNEDEVELTLEERNALAALPREMAPGDLLEARVVRALKAEGHFGGERQRGNPFATIWKVAAALALFAGGVATGRYVVAASGERSSAAVPSVELREAPATSTRTDTARSPKSETVVAQREMWL